MHSAAQNTRFPAQVDDVTVRLIAAVVLVLAVTALVGRQWWILALLAVDFVLRAAVGPRSSPVARFVGAALRPRIGVAPRPTPGAPKRFAAAIGAVLTSVATVTWSVHLGTGSSVALAVTVALTVVMVVFPLLEAALGLCVGCVIFGRLMAWGLVPEEVCLDCADITRRRVVPTT